jgi:SAM-dependent methyltransferase
MSEHRSAMPAMYAISAVLFVALVVQTYRVTEWCRVAETGNLMTGESMMQGRRLEQREDCPRAWYDATFGTEHSLLDAVYGKIFGGEAINYKHTAIPKWAEVKASELHSNAKLKETDVVLDLGCGPGFIARAVKKRVLKVYCWDVNYDMNQYARKTHGSALEYGLTPRQEVNKHPLVGVPDNSLDVFYAYAVFIHHDIYTFVCYFAELATKMRMNGRVYIQFLPGESFDPADPTFREHYNIWAANPKFWTMAMHWNSKRSIVQTARCMGSNRSGWRGTLASPIPQTLMDPTCHRKRGTETSCFRK